MPRAKSSAASSRTLAQTVHEKALDPSRVLSGGALEDVIRVRGARQHNLKNVT